MGSQTSKEEDNEMTTKTTSTSYGSSSSSCDADELKTNEYWFPNRFSFLTPKVIDLRRTVCFPYPEPKDQGPDGSCVAYAMSTALMCLQRNLKIPYNEYYLFDENEFFQRSRDQLNVTRPVSKGLTFSEAVQGLCQQSVSKQNKKVVEWKRIGISVDNFCAALANGYPIVFGIQVNSALREWQHNRNKIVDTDYVIPSEVIQSYQKQKTSTAAIGTDSTNTTFHCILLIGYDKQYQVFIARNSWGMKWGHFGHFFVPFRLVRDDESFALDAMICVKDS
jgi:C1A family cysteine protease